VDAVYVMPRTIDFDVKASAKYVSDSTGEQDTRRQQELVGESIEMQDKRAMKYKRQSKKYLPSSISPLSRNIPGCSLRLAQDSTAMLGKEKLASS
jgi:hypothetical protein